MINKTCRGCQLDQPIDNFYKHSRMADGHLNFCKTCKRVDATVHRSANLDHYQAYDRKRSLENEERKKKHRERSKANYAKKKSLGLPPNNLTWSHRHPEKTKATRALNNAIRDGKITRQPCQRCGKNETVHGHHEDYTKPLDVVWFCVYHHFERHRELNESVRTGLPAPAPF